MPLGHQPDLAASWYPMGQPSAPEDYRARSRAPPVRVLLGVRPLHRSDTMGAQSDCLCVGNNSVQRGCLVSGVFASAGVVAAVAIWTMGNINLRSEERRVG